MDRDGHIAVAGGGQAGGRAAQAARRAGHTGPITIFAAEPELPYERPPLSKGVLTGKQTVADAHLAASDSWDDEAITVRAATPVRAIDRGARTVTTDTGEVVGYDGLVLATGSHALRPAWPGADLPGVRTFRTAADAHAVRDSLAAGERVVLIGGGYIGMEIAAAARARGADVTVLEAAEGVMTRQVVPEVGAWFLARHRQRGTEIVTGARVSGFTGERHVTGVELADGTVYPCERAVIGVGIRPATELAEAAGLTVSDGIVTDAAGRTDDPAIVAAGDCTRHWNPALGRSTRLESWDNAERQARAAGATLAGTPTEVDALPWFWSDQGEDNLQLIGLPETWDETIVRGDPDGEAFTVLLLAEGRVVGAQAVNRGGDIAAAKRLIARGVLPPRDLLADASLPLKRALKQAG